MRKRDPSISKANRSAAAKLAWANKSEESKKELSLKISKRNKDYWNSLSEEDRLQLIQIKSKQSKDYWNSLSDEEKADISQKNSQREKDRWNNKSDEEKENHRNHCIKMGKDFRATLDDKSSYFRDLATIQWGNRSEEEKQIIMEKLKEDNNKWRNNLTDEDKAIQNQKLKDNWTLERKSIASQKSKKYWKNLTDEEREIISQDRSQRMKEYWSSLLPEERRIQEYKMITGRAESARDKPITNELELKFQKILDELNIPYQYQYTTVQSPKNWDFAIYDNPDALPIMLVDIDGSIHDSIFPIDPDEHHGFSDFHELMLYYDNKRTEQTDGIDYFIIDYNTFEDDVEELMKKLKR
jgi:hypothetical protein